MSFQDRKHPTSFHLYNKTRHSYMFSTVDQTAGQNRLTFFVDTHWQPGSDFVFTKIRFLFSQIFYLKSVDKDVGLPAVLYSINIIFTF